MNHSLSEAKLILADLILDELGVKGAKMLPLIENTNNIEELRKGMKQIHQMLVNDKKDAMANKLFAEFVKIVGS